MCVWRCLAGGWAIRSRGDKSPQKPSIQTFPNQSCQRQTVPKERCEKDVKSKIDIKIIELNFMIIQHKVLWTIGTRGLHSIARHGGDKKIDSEETHKTLSYAEFWNCLESVIHSILNPRHASRKGRLLTWTRTAWKRKTRAETLRYAGGSGSEGAQHQRQIVFIPCRGHISSLNNCRCSSDNCNFGSQIKSSPVFAFLLLLVPMSSTWRVTQTWFLHKNWHLLPHKLSHWLSHKHKSLFSPTAAHLQVPPQLSDLLPRPLFLISSRCQTPFSCLSL